ncbi:hypothetical protein MMC06_006734 [Schaereria dolodes]|nr:hypothetical protein [Schaereria dolodes]
MATSIAATRQNNGLAGVDQELLEYEKIIKLRDEIFTGTHPRLKNPALATTNTSLYPIESSSKSTAQLSNGITTSSKVTADDAPPLSYHSQHAASRLPLSSNPRQTSTSGTGSSGLDPIFLTKSEDLVRAEMRLERQRIERSLEEQCHQRRLALRQKAHDQDATPDFDVTEVLLQAQELVKPIILAENTGANGIASSSDSFDENTFYSSQINESTTEEADEYSKWRPHKPCKYFFAGSCKKGDACTFSHDPAFKQQLQRSGSLTMGVDNFEAEESAGTRHQRRHSPLMDNQPTDANISPPEASRTGEPDRRSGAQNNTERGPHHTQDESAYSPPSYEEQSSHHRATRPRQSDGQEVSAYSHRDLVTFAESSKAPNTLRRGARISPLSHDIRIVRNHITSPVAPQPARVSPLAVAKVPQISQIQCEDSERHISSRPRPRPESVHESPNGRVKPINTRKRRRDPESGEKTRSFIVRRRIESPEPYIKEEPLSPIPFLEGSGERQSRHRQVGKTPLLVDTAAPYSAERIAYPRRSSEYKQRSNVGENTPSTPIVPRVVSRVGQHYEVHEETDLRRVVSARHLQRARSPITSSMTFVAPDIQHDRAASQSYLVQPNAEHLPQYRSSVQPQPASMTRRDRSLSPLPQQTQYSPAPQEISPMAPPPRRIVVDQYGNKYYESPVVADRRASVAPPSHGRSDVVAPYDQTISRHSSVYPRNLKSHDDRGYIQRIASPGPTSPRYVEYLPAAEPLNASGRQRIYEPVEKAYVSRRESTRLGDYPRVRQTSHYEEIAKPREELTRMRSVRPIEMPYESPRDHVLRVQSVRPEQERIVSLSGRRELVHPATRQLSLRAEDEFTKPTSYMVPERPRYQYIQEAQEPRYIDDDEEDLVIEAPRSAGRRHMQRL